MHCLIEESNTTSRRKQKTITRISFVNKMYIDKQHKIKYQSQSNAFMPGYLCDKRCLGF